MAVRFLLFRGQWENEGKFYALESPESIVVLATGKDFSLIGTQEQQIGRDYLKENRKKVKAIVVPNTSWQNVSLLGEITNDLGPQTPLYTSFQSKLILRNLFPQLKNRIVVVAKNREFKIGDFTSQFFPLSSYLIGNLAVVLHYQQSSFYFIEDLVFSNLLDNQLFFPYRFAEDFPQFLNLKKKHTYLITSCWGMHWNNKSSLLFARQELPFPANKQPLFFIFYDFDWLHLIELLEITRQWEKKVKILNEDFIPLVNEVLAKSYWKEVVAKKEEKSEILLLVGNHQNITDKLNYYLAGFSPAEKASFHFVVGLPPVVGGEEKLARLVDYLYTQSENITNLSKKKYLSLGTSFYDFKLLIQLLQPSGIIACQNSYKNEKFFPYLPNRFWKLNNGHVAEFPVRKVSSLPTKRTSLISLEELLIKQRENLRQGGLFIILLFANWKGEELKLKKIRTDNLAVGSNLNVPKLEEKIKNWWETEIGKEIKKTDSSKAIKKFAERKLKFLVSRYLSFKHEMEVEEIISLLFVHH